jgi:hypothetical protein
VAEDLGSRRQSDPFVQVMVCNKPDTHDDTDEPPEWMQITPVHRNAKTDVEWNDLELSVEVPRKEIVRKERCIRILVLDCVDGKRHAKFICQSASMDKLLVLGHLGHWVDVEGNLVDAWGEQVGRYATKIRYVEKVEEEVEFGYLDLSQVVVTHLRCDGKMLVSCVVNAGYSLKVE